LRSERRAAIRESVVHRVRDLAADIAELREGARQLLLAIAQLEAVRSRQSEACSGLLAMLRTRYPNYALLGAADLQGRIFCSSGPAPASVGDQSFFTRAVAHDGLVVGNYWVDPADGEKMINFAVQITGVNGMPAGVIFAGLGLDWLSDHLKEGGLSPTSSKLIADRAVHDPLMGRSHVFTDEVFGRRGRMGGSDRCRLCRPNLRLYPREFAAKRFLPE
jgi:hypothetical protein